MEQRPELLAQGPSAALYAIVDRVVDDYEPVLAELDSSIRETETDVFSPSSSNPAGRIYQLKRAVLDLHAALGPLVPAVDKLATIEHPLIDEDMQPYFRDIHDHLLRATGQVQGYRELLTNVLAANLTQASVRQNEDVRKISAWAAIIAVPTLISGIYGMNFEHMPELGWTLGYPLALFLMAARVPAALPAVPPRRLAVARAGRTPCARTSPRAWAPKPRAPCRRRLRAACAARPRLRAAPRSAAGSGRTARRRRRPRRP